MDSEFEIINGVIENITHYFEDKDGFTVMEILSEGEAVTVVGNFPRLANGESVALKGKWSFSPAFGRQFRAELLQHSLPQDTDGIFHYLSSGIIKGVGEATAMKIIEAFGANTFDVIENDVDRLAAVNKIGRRRAGAIQKEFKAQTESREIIMSLTDLGLTQSEALRAYKTYNRRAFEIINENPYQFVSDSGLSFERAEEIAPHVHSHNLAENRNTAGVVYIVRRNLSNGHTCVPRSAVAKRAGEYFECGEDAAEIAIDSAVDSGALISAELGGREFLFVPEIYDAEHAVAERISVMANYPPVQISVYKEEISAFETVNGIEFDEKQRLAIETAVNKGLLILTGGPGTGKTTTVKAMITLMKNKGLGVMLCAPTGRAAKRMSELTGFEAKTIHRLLEAVKGDDSQACKFTHNRKNPLEADAVIVDELSMVDITLFAALLDALPLSARLIMVGDKNQLPPVGAGNVLGDLIESEKITVVELEKIFRQAQKSLIVTNAHKVVKGVMPDISNKNAKADFFFMKEFSPDSAAKKITELVKTRLPSGYGFDSIADIQVLCPGRKGTLGSENLNILLQNALNPKSPRKAELPRKGFVFREGDKVMQVKNNYDIELVKFGEYSAGVFNGDIGIIKKIERAAGTISVAFDSGDAVYPIESAAELELAYAMTVHKSQGSEFAAVVMPVLAAPPKLQYRNLFYTAITRAKNLLVLVGADSTIKSMVSNDKKSRRYSALGNFLAGEK
ncbi:MAG: ATP-dependent RecD-like DNA helicase [Clostridiales bacterium]|nr:ATP-dependent RecD-like DNA helicase [Clostridiales bacterium]